MNEILEQILRRIEGSPQWWARLSYRDSRYWTPEELVVLAQVFGDPS